MIIERKTIYKMETPIYLNALKAFEASARNKSFSAAARELNVTPAAVGQLVRGLEDHLGIILFHRQSGGKNRLVPTALAESVLPEIRAGFDKLSVGLEKLKRGNSTNILTVTVSPAFAAKWLLPKIDKFQSLFPEIAVRLDTNLRPIDFIENGIDIGVRYGEGHWEGLEAIKLMEEDIFPVCSPTFLANKSDLSINTILQATLIHDLTMEAHKSFPTWTKWLEYVGLENSGIKSGLQINNSASVLQAALDGQGIALARSVMAKEDIKAGRLIHLFEHVEYKSPLAYYIVYRPECLNMSKILEFKKWLIIEAKSLID